MICISISFTVDVTDVLMLQVEMFRISKEVTLGNEADHKNNSKDW
jgi:hypothetical protein